MNENVSRKNFSVSRTVIRKFLSSSYPNAESNSKVDLTEAEKSSANQTCFAGEESQDKESDNRTKVQ